MMVNPKPAKAVALFVALFSLSVSFPSCSGESWPQVAFLPWLKIAPSAILVPVPLEVPTSTLGSVQPRKFTPNPLKDRPRCNRQMPDKSWVPDWCDWQLTRAE